MCLDITVSDFTLSSACLLAFYILTYIYINFISPRLVADRQYKTVTVRNNLMKLNFI